MKTEEKKEKNSVLTISKKTTPQKLSLPEKEGEEKGAVNLESHAVLVGGNLLHNDWCSNVIRVIHK